VDSPYLAASRKIFFKNEFAVAVLPLADPDADFEIVVRLSNYLIVLFGHHSLLPLFRSLYDLAITVW
jgi:hypothetical protein